jgi:hypothetical protein
MLSEGVAIMGVGIDRADHLISDQQWQGKRGVNWLFRF